MLALLIVLCASLPAAGQHAPPAAPDRSLPEPRSLAVDDWRSDLRFLAAAIADRHPAPFHHVSREAFAAAVEELDSRLPTLGYAETLVELSRLVALLGPGDGHSRVQLSPRFVPRQLPLRFWRFADGLWVRAAAPEHAALVGRRVVALGGLPVERALELVAEIVAADNESDRMLKVPVYLVLPEMLQGLGLAGADGLAIELERGDGDAAATSSVTVPFAPWPGDAAHSIGAIAHDPAGLGAADGWVEMRPATVPAPLYLSRPRDWYWMTELAEGRVLYAQFNVVGNQQGRPRLSEFFAELFERAEAESVAKLVLDVRLNGGGNNFFNRPFIHGLIRSDTKNARGRTYVLIGRNTFSAAQNLVTRLSHETEAVFVGEPTGGSPNHYGDARRVTLPASGLEVSISTLYWQDGGPLDRRPWVAPDIAVDVTGADFAAGRDPVLDRVLALDPEVVATPLDRRLLAAFDSGGLTAALEAYEAYRADPANRYVDTERAINRAGYVLLGDGRVEQAIVVFRANVEAYPESWNTHDSLGEGLMEAGRIGAAIESYERSLELNPHNAAGARILERLRHMAAAGHADPG